MKNTDDATIKIKLGAELDDMVMLGTHMACSHPLGYPATYLWPPHSAALTPKPLVPVRGAPAPPGFDVTNSGAAITKLLPPATNITSVKVQRSYHGTRRILRLGVRLGVDTTAAPQTDTSGGRQRAQQQHNQETIPKNRGPVQTGQDCGQPPWRCERGADRYEAR